MESNLCVLIDFENIAAGTEKEGLGRFDVDAVMQRIKDKGRVLIARSYADWGRFARFKQGLLAANVTMFELTSHGMQDKNRADIAMVVDALEIAFTHDYIDTFVVLSGDSDFTPMVLKMRELNKKVIGVGTRSSSSRLLIGACDEFIFYDSVVASKRTRATPTVTKKIGDKPNLGEALELMVDAVEGMQREDPISPLASVVKSIMQRKVPEFHESDFGFSSFTKFLQMAEKRGLITLSRDSKSGGYRVDAADGSEDGGGRDNGESREEHSTGVWIDPYAPEGSAKFIELLDGDGYNPLAAPTRKALLQHLEESVSFRSGKRRRLNVQFVQEDVRKRLRKTHPDVPSKAIKAIFNALMRAQVFMHRDGTPVRTGLAPFSIDKDSEELNSALARVYLEMLYETGTDLSNSALLAELLLGDAKRNKEIEETVAWLAASVAEPDEDDEESSNGMGSSVDDMDDLLMVELTEETAAAPAEVAPIAEPEAEVEEKPKKRTRKKKKVEVADEGAPSDLDALLEASDASPAVEEPVTAPDAPAELPPADDDTVESLPDDAVEVSADVSEDKPKPRTTRTRKKKAAEPSDDDDVLVEGA